MVEAGGWGGIYPHYALHINKGKTQKLPSGLLLTELTVSSLDKCSSNLQLTAWKMTQSGCTASGLLTAMMTEPYDAQ